MGGDTGDEGDAPLLANMVDILKNELGDTNIILLCLDFSQRFGPHIKDMISELEALFGRKQFWKHVIINVTFWKYTADAIKDRRRTAVTEEIAIRQINEQ